ncbi:patatin-like phospholipase family protein [Flavobacterium granuli]|uniref:Patatin-like phospholipase n=1 Tax=Flavobacterium granuli TaxID=280093 RepID=A0A1M5TP26_9FLAO|nr:patatin-like phospholipase family protein [Flavobacterium granuli]PRZ19817.1 patatin-like phospholipase [Flavobacterium granuli]SHH52449.1 Patatin-like phospholipase [Flavobacterium granuli]
MKALVISGGGSKGAFAGGVAQYLLQNKNKNYDLFIGTSTGSLLIPHLALGKIDKIYSAFTEVNMAKIFDVNPFIVKNKNGIDTVTINHFNIIKQFFRRRRTFGESKRLLNYIKESFTMDDFRQLKALQTDIVISVTNLSKNRAEYKSIHDCNYDEFCNWIWISSNYIPFMSLVSINGFDYGDGGFSSLVPIQQAIIRGATEIDVIVLETEKTTAKIAIGKNPFSLLIDLFRIELDQIEKHDILLGKLTAADNNVKLNIFYTPIELTHNALVFNNDKMKEWWKTGFDYAQNKSEPKENLI